ncbi:MAG TPA: 5-formyltetrahydrofolate cyclo-ligase [Rhodanobacteraceae bacterium]
MSDMHAQRQSLRDQLSAQRRALGASERLRAAQGLRHSLGQLPEFLVDERIAGYWAHAGELPLNLVLAPMAERGQQFHLPVIGPERQLRFAPWQVGDAITPNHYGIPEPEAREHALPPNLMDVVLVPLVGFDRRGHRLGFGGGYYDASFAFLREEQRPATPLLIGIGYAFQELEAIDAAPWDVRLDYIATERELIDCTEPDAP